MVHPSFLTVPLLAAAAHAVQFDCARVLTDGVSFDLSKLGGPRSVYSVDEQPPSVSNTTFTIDLCQPLKKAADLEDGEQCPMGTRVCAVERDYNTVENTTTVRRVIPIAGDFTTTLGRALDPKITRIKNSASNSDSEKEGIIVEFNGGRYPDTSNGRTQKAIIQLECDPKRTGLEGSVQEEQDVEKREDESGDDKEGGDKEEVESALQLISYKAEDTLDVLRLTWSTKYACEDVPADEGAGSPSQGWGFFGWFFIILFLGVAAYLIFGSWLNYSRYGARGWDLLPHGDAIRDLPYILKDWGRNIKDTVGGSGSRGGYSAV